MKSKKIQKIVPIIILIFLIGCVVSRYFNPNYKNIPFEKIAESEVKLTLNSQQLLWFTLRDESFNGFFDISMLDMLGVDYSDIEIDYNKHTYVVTIGYELTDLSYSYSEMKNRKLVIFPKQFIGKVELKDEFNEMIYIYKIERLDIDCDYHDRAKNVSFT